jgi:hypothetical protein
MGRSASTVSARRVAGVLGGLGLGALGGFVASLLRSRPPTIYTDGLQSSRPRDGGTRDDATGLPTSADDPDASGAVPTTTRGA